MVNLKNLKVEEIKFESNDKNFKKCIEYIKLIDPNYEKYMPKKPKHRLSFELVDANVDLANTIRRYMIDEIPVTSMHVDIADIKTDDVFILTDYFKKNIELIPILQDVEYDGITISLDVKNTTDEIKPIYAGHIAISDKKGKQLNTADYFSETFILTNLRPMCSISIPNISTVVGVGKEDAGKFCLLSNMTYEILDVDPVIEDKYEKRGQSSLISNPSHFKFTMTTHRNVSIKKLFEKCCNLIVAKFDGIYKEINDIKENEVYFSPTMNVEIKEDINIFHFTGEFWTISNIISRYCYLADENILFVCSNITHPSIEESMVKIKHPHPKKLILNAIKKILDDFKTLQKKI